MSKQVSLEQTPAHETIDTGRTNCACGCGTEADQIYKGIPIPAVNPILHYRRYQARQRQMEELRYGLQL